MPAHNKYLYLLLLRNERGMIRPKFCVASVPHCPVLTEASPGSVTRPCFLLPSITAPSPPRTQLVLKRDLPSGDTRSRWHRPKVRQQGALWIHAHDTSKGTYTRKAEVVKSFRFPLYSGHLVHFYCCNCFLL